MGIDTPPEIDLGSIDPNAPSDDELEFLSNGNRLRKASLRNSARLVKEEIQVRQQRAEAAAPKPEWDEDLLLENPYPDAERDTELDRLIDNVDIIDAYAKWCGKMVPDAKGKREGIFISCPTDHADTHPSAWINLDKQTWFCGTCQIGGDKFDIAAHNKGFSIPGYKTDGTFPELRRQMAMDFGYVVKRTPSGETFVEEMETVYEDEVEAPDLGPDGESELADESVGSEITTPQEPLLDVHELPSPDDLVEPEPQPIAKIIELRPAVDEDEDLLGLEWEECVPKDTYLYEYMTQTCHFDIPHEFHFWLAMQTIAFANGFDVRVEDVPYVNGNLYVVLVGPTGLGKSRATYSARQLVREVMPWTGTSAMPGTGVKILGGLESGQALINGVSHEFDDPAPTVPGTKLKQENVRGWSISEEFAGFVKRAMRMGSDFKERAIEFYDVQKDGDVASTSMKHGEILTKGPFLQITSTTQSEAVHAYLTSEDVVSGFLNRFMFVQGPSREERPARWTMAHAPDLRRASAGLAAIQSFAAANADHILTWTPNGDAAWDYLYREISVIQGQAGPMSIRLDLLIKKCLLLFCLNEHKLVIDADMVNRMEPVMKHLLRCMQNITGDLYWRADDDCQDAILRYVHLKNDDGKHPRKRDIIDAIKRPQQGRSRFEVSRALELLEKTELLSLVQIESTGKRGPKRHGYKVGVSSA